MTHASVPYLRHRYRDSAHETAETTVTPRPALRRWTNGRPYVAGKEVTAAVTPPGAPTIEEEAALRAVLYASIFDYPLSAEELRRTLTCPCASVADLRALIAGSPFLRSRVECVDDWYVPAGGRDLVAERRERRARSLALLAAHRSTLDLLRAVPFTRLVAISGSLAHLNADGDADLDLFIVTRHSRVWSVTLLLVLIAKMLGRRRMVCVNYVIADSRLVLEQSDLYTASQVLHLRPIFGLDTYRRFLAANPFVSRWFPNAASEPAAPLPLPRPSRWCALKPVLEALLWLPSGLIERACRAVYGWHLRRKVATWQSPDQVRMDPDCLKLHTNSHRAAVLERYEQLVAAAMPPTPAARPRSGAWPGSSSARAG